VKIGGFAASPCGMLEGFVVHPFINKSERKIKTLIE
jgi:hypothetical protein